MRSQPYVGVMTSRLYIGNLSDGTTDGALSDELTMLGLRVLSVHIVLNRATGHSRGFAFVELRGDGDAAAAMITLEHALIGGRIPVLRDVPHL
jgi:RNA recognition motif-containing protein